MKTVAPLDFSLLIAFLLPGFVTFYALGYVSATTASLIEKSVEGSADLGVGLFVILYSLAAGVVISAIRAQILDVLQRKTGVPTATLNYAKLKDESTLKAFKEAIANTYRFSQFYGNMFISLVLLIAVKYQSLTSLKSEPFLFVLLLGTAVVLFISHRRELRDTYLLLHEILKD